MTEVVGGVALGALMDSLGLKLLKYIENEHTELEVLVTLSLVLYCQLSPSFPFFSCIRVVVMGLLLNRQILINEDGLQKHLGTTFISFGTT